PRIVDRGLGVDRRLLREAGLAVRARVLDPRIGGTARDRVRLVLVRVVDRLTLDLHAAVLPVAKRRGAELARHGLLVALVPLGPAEGLVLGLVVRPVLEARGRVVLELPDLLLGLVLLLRPAACLGGLVVTPAAVLA